MLAYRSFPLWLLRCTCRKFSFTLWVWLSVKQCNKTLITGLSVWRFLSEAGLKQSRCWLSHRAYTLIIATSYLPRHSIGGLRSTIQWLIVALTSVLIWSIKPFSVHLLLHCSCCELLPIAWPEKWHHEFAYYKRMKSVSLRCFYTRDFVHQHEVNLAATIFLLGIPLIRIFRESRVKIKP